MRASNKSVTVSGGVSLAILDSSTFGMSERHYTCAPGYRAWVGLE